MELSTASLSSVITVPSLTSTALPYHHEHYVCHYHSYQPLFYLNSPPSPSSSPPTHCCRSRCAIAGDVWAHVHETCPSTPRKLWWGTYTAPRIRTHVFVTVGSNFHSIIECHLNGCGCDLAMNTMCSECPCIRMYIHMYVSALWAAQVIMYLLAPPLPLHPDPALQITWLNPTDGQYSLQWDFSMCTPAPAGNLATTITLTQVTWLLAR